MAFFSSTLSTRLVISLEDHALPLIYNSPTQCQTGAAVISFHPSELRPSLPAAVNISELYFEPRLYNVHPGSDSKLRGARLCVVLM